MLNLVAAQRAIQLELDRPGKEREAAQTEWEQRCAEIERQSAERKAKAEREKLRSTSLSVVH
jgi:hypothetical protein